MKYPTLDTVGSNQGVGPHYDAGFLTFVCPFPSKAHYFNQLHQSYYKHPLIPASRFKTLRETGLMYHLLRTRSWSTSGKVRMTHTPLPSSGTYSLQHLRWLLRVSPVRPRTGSSRPQKVQLHAILSPSSKTLRKVREAIRFTSTVSCC